MAGALCFSLYSKRVDYERGTLPQFGVSLDGPALQWFVANHSKMEVATATWGNVKELFLTRFRPLTFNSDIAQMLYTVKQKEKEDLQRYAARFQALHSRWTGGPTLDSILSFWIAGMKDVAVRTKLYEVAVVDFATATDTALRFECARILSAKDTLQTNSNGKGGSRQARKS
ncbi:MAG: hypothetical protein Aurels2KO_58440 [Aureliella sp.]